MYASNFSQLKYEAPKTAELLSSVGGDKDITIGDFKKLMNRIIWSHTPVFDKLLRSLCAEAPHININEDIF